MSILNTGFDGLSDGDFVQKANFIVTQLGKPPASIDFAAVVPTPADVATEIDAFEAKIAMGNAPGAAADRDATREVLDSMLKAVAASLESISKDRTLLAHTGFDLRKAPERDTTPTGTPQNVSVRPTGNQGEARLRASAVPQARTYEARATQDFPSGAFTSGTPATGVRGLLFTGLERGKDWFFQIRAIGPNGPGPWSAPAMMMVV